MFLFFLHQNRVKPNNKYCYFIYEHEHKQYCITRSIFFLLSFFIFSYILYFILLTTSTVKYVLCTLVCTYICIRLQVLSASYFHRKMNFISGDTEEHRRRRKKSLIVHNIRNIIHNIDAFICANVRCRAIILLFTVSRFFHLLFPKQDNLSFYFSTLYLSLPLCILGLSFSYSIILAECRCSFKMISTLV